MDTSQNNVFDQFDQPNIAPGTGPQGKKAKAGSAIFSAAEAADVDAQEGRLQDSNVQSLLGEIGRLKPGDKRRAVLEGELANLTKDGGPNPFDQFDKPGMPKGVAATEAPGKKKTLLDVSSVTDAKEHALNLWRNESMVGHMYNAYQKGVFEKSMKDLVKSVPEQVKDFSLPELWNSAKDDPKQFAGVLLDSLVADPYLLLAPAGLGGRLAFRLGTMGAKAGKAAGVAAQVAGRAAEGGVVGAGLMTPISIAEQLDKNGYVDPRQVGEDMKMGATMAGVLTAAVHLGADVKGVKPAQVYAKVKEGVAKDNLAPVEALQKAFKDFGIEDTKAEPIIAEVAEHDRMEKANAMYSEQVKKGLNPELPVKKDVVAREKEVAFLLKAKTDFESQAPAAQVAREQPVATTLDQIPDLNRMREQYERGIVLGAEAALAKDAAERTPEDLVALRVQAKLQDFKASDNGVAALPAVGRDTHLGRELLSDDHSTEVRAKSALELPVQARTVGDLAAIEAENMKLKGPYAPLTQFWPMVGVGTVAAGLGYAFDPNWERDLALGAGAVLAVKAKGGMWHPEAVSRLAKPLEERLIPTQVVGSKVQAAQAAWAEKSVKNYLNKHAGTESDPLKDVEIPIGDSTIRWEQATDEIIRGSELTQFPGQKEWNITRGEPGMRGGSYGNALTSYLSHVGDYLREFVPAEKLGQYDLVRAVKETAANDTRVAKEMQKSAAASTESLPVHKAYPDGSKWIEFKLPEKLTPEQAKGVRASKPTDMGRDMRGRDEPTGWSYLALDSKGKSIRNNYTEELAGGSTPEEAWLAGRLAEEGNTMGHCVGSSCGDVSSGSSKIYSLRDAKGGSHVTIEVAPPGAFSHGQKLRETEDILQIKGKQNRAPAPEYLPYVQDFVKSGKWGEVGDLANTGLVDVHAHFNEPDIRARFPARYITKEEFLKEIRDPKDEIFGIGRRRGELGSIDPTFAKYLALTAGAGLIGSYLADDPKTGGLLGVALAAGGLPLSRGVGKILANAERKLSNIAIGPRDTRFRIDGMVNDFQEGVAHAGISAMQSEHAFKQLVPNAKRREEFTHFIQEGGSNGPRTAAEEEYVRLMVQGFKGILEKEKAAGVIEQGIEDGSYITQYWSGNKDAVLKAQRIFSGMSAKNPNAMKRAIPDYRTGMAAGLKPKTLDSAEIFGMRMKSSGVIIERSKFTERLKDGVTPTNERLLVPRTDSAAAQGYTDVNHPSLMPYRVHPDIAPTLRTLYTVLEPNAIIDSLNLVSSASKRAIFSMSAFHPKSLLDALIGTSRFLRTGPRSWSYLPRAHRAVMMKDSGDLMRTAVVDGHVKIDPKHGYDIEYDLMQKALGKMVDSSAGWVSKGRTALAAGGAAIGFVASDYEPGGALAGAALAFGGGRKGIQLAKFVDAKSQQFLWGYLHPTMKIAFFGAEFERALATNAKRAARGEPTKPRDQIAREVGGSANDFFGGQDWVGMAQTVQGKYGRNMAMALAQPGTQRALQMIFQAPDWGVSTFKSIAKAIPGVADKDVAAVHRSYILSSMLMYATVIDAINVQMSGHHFWENKDWTRVDMGDGRTMQTNKHFMEFFHWMDDTGQTFYNKLAFWPSEVAEQINNRKWLTSGKRKPAPPITDVKKPFVEQIPSRSAHIAKRFIPIWGSQETGERALSGFAGVPIYGEETSKAEERKATKKEERNSPEAREARREKRRQKREER